MSVEAMALALHHSEAKGTAKVVLLGIANHDGDGGAWPSIPTLSAYANVDERGVQRAIDSLLELGELRRDVQAGGLRHMADYDRPNLYQLTLRCPPNCDGTTAHRVLCQACGKPLKPRERKLRVLFHKTEACLPHPVAPAPPGGASATPGGGASTTQTVLEPSRDIYNYPTQPQTARAHGARCTGSISGIHDFHPETGWCRNACGIRDER